MAAMTAPKSKPAARSTDTSAAVDLFMERLQHPFKAEIQALRKIILTADPAVSEGVK